MAVVFRSTTVVGAGAVGCYFGAKLAQAGHAVTLVARPAHVEAIRSRGLQLQTGGQTHTDPIGASTTLDAAKGLIFTQVVPFPWDAQQPVVREYQAAMRKADPAAAFSFSSLEGYLGGRLLVEALKRARAPTREGVVQAFESMGALDLGGFAVSYGPGALAGASLVDTVIATAKGGFRH